MRVAIRVPDVERGAPTERAPALRHAAVKRDAARAQVLGDRAQVVASNRQAHVIEPASGIPRRREQIDQVLPEPQLNERDRLVHVIDRAAEHLGIEASGRGLVLHTEHDVVEAERFPGVRHRPNHAGPPASGQVVSRRDSLYR